MPLIAPNYKICPENEDGCSHIQSNQYSTQELIMMNKTKQTKLSDPDKLHHLCYLKKKCFIDGKMVFS